MIVDRKIFFEKIKKSLFGGRFNVNVNQVLGVDDILDACEKEGVTDKRYIAYIFATAYHETGATMMPVREGYKKTDVDSIAHVTKMFNRGEIKSNYALPSVNGLSYFGRGYVQLTWPNNYKKMGLLLGLDLYNHPEQALNPKIAALILIKGMVLGTFTGKKLSDYINEKQTDYIRARKTVNGVDKANLIATYAYKFEKSLI